MGIDGGDMHFTQKAKHALQIVVRLVHMTERHPVILVPFVVLCLYNLLVLGLLFFAPQPPFERFFSPLISALWGEEYLHYPANLVLLPKLYSIETLISAPVVSVLFAGLITVMVHQTVNGAVIDLRFGLRKTLRRFWAYATVWAVSIIVTLLTYASLEYAAPFLSSRELVPALGFLATFILQLPVLYFAPAFVVENRKLWPAVKRSSQLLRSSFAETVILAAMVSAALLPFLFAYARLQSLMELLQPEIVVAALLVKAAAAGLMEFLLVAAVTLLFCEQKSREKAVA